MGGALRPADLTGRERQLRSGFHAMTLIAARFARAARRTLPFLLRRKARLDPLPVSIVDASIGVAEPCFVMHLEGAENSTWGRLTLNSRALELLLEGSLGGGSSSGGGQLKAELTLAQKALVSRIAKSLAEDFAQAMREEAGLSLVVSGNGSSASEGKESSTPDGLEVACVFAGLDDEATVSIAVGAEALEIAAREQGEDQAPSTGDPRMAEALEEVPVEAIAYLGTVKLGLRSVLSLRVGQVLRLPTAIDDPVKISIGGVARFEGRPVVSRGQLSVEIRSRLG
jgi:flagellar motor switch protein FliM